MNYSEYFNSHLATYVDIDNAYGCQCWDGAMDYLRSLTGGVIHTDIHGFACDIWESRATNGILQYCDEIPIAKAKQGDIFVFKSGGDYCPYSHIAMLHELLGNGFGRFFGTNQGGVNGVFTLFDIPLRESFATCFRPKCNNTKGVATMYCIFKIVETGKEYYFDGHSAREIKDKDEKNILNEIYKENNGKDIPYKEWSNKAPWYIRLLDVSERESAEL